ncbi:MAG: AtpZ/AtpI family protein [Dehalococcoidia bacterium]
MNGWLVALRLTGLGWYIATCVVLGIVGGWGLDKLIGTIPIFTLIGTVLGSIAAFWGVYRMILPVLYGSNNRDSTRKGRGR